MNKKFKLDFLRNYCAELNQILYESFRVQENEDLSRCKQSFVNSLALEDSLDADWSLMKQKDRSGSRTVPCVTPEETSALSVNCII